MVAELLARGATVRAYDPAAMHEARRVFGEQPGLEYADGPMEAAQDADAVVIVTEWKEFRSPDFDALKATLRQPVLVDGRNMYVPELPRASGLEYHSIGRR